ncbi:MAG: YqhA family protein [Mariprofundaceae bacterium]|nr:YqhA family protein [Mariprofundaceae bacterium]
MKIIVRGSDVVKEMFEKILWSSRYVVLLAVISSIVGMLLLFLLSAADMANLAWEFIEYSLLGVEKENFHITVVSHVITAVDDFLLATVLLIFALGLYELFISKLNIAEDEVENANNILMISSLDDLKDRLGKVIMMILIVTFFKNVLYVTFDNPLNILYMGAGILMISLAGYFSHKSSSH